MKSTRVRDGTIKWMQQSATTLSHEVEMCASGKGALLGLSIWIQISKVLNLNKLSKLGLRSITGKCFDNDYNNVKLHTQRNTYNINYGHLNGHWSNYQNYLVSFKWQFFKSNQFQLRNIIHSWKVFFKTHKFFL